MSGASIYSASKPSWVDRSARSASGRQRGWAISTEHRFLPTGLPALPFCAQCLFVCIISVLALSCLLSPRNCHASVQVLPLSLPSSDASLSISCHSAKDCREPIGFARLSYYYINLLWPHLRFRCGQDLDASGVHLRRKGARQGSARTD